MVGITGFGGYVPRRRLQRSAMVEANNWFNPGLKSYAKGERSMCNWDEDTITMAVEAIRDMLQGERPDDITALFLASTTLPFVDRQNAGIMATALNLHENLMTMDFSSSMRAGTTGLTTALRVAQGQSGQVIFAASEHRRAKQATANELLYGDGAVAFSLGEDDVAVELVGSYQLSTDFIDHYRGQNDDFDYNWEERWIRDEGYVKLVPKAVQGALDATGLKVEDIDHFVMPATIRNVGKLVAAQTGIDAKALRSNLDGVLGETGTAHALVMLVDCLQDAKADENIMVIGWGQGCDALILRTTDKLATIQNVNGIKGSLARRKEETNYNKYAAFNGLSIMEQGLRGEVDKRTALSSLYRNKKTILGFVGGKCSKCGTVQYPKTKVCVNPNCGAFHTQEDQPFAETPALVQSWTADNLTYTEDPPQHFGMITFADGGRLMADFTDVDVGKVAVGDKMRMAFRIKEFDAQRNFTRYFWKATPAA